MYLSFIYHYLLAAQEFTTVDINYDAGFRLSTNMFTIIPGGSDKISPGCQITEPNSNIIFNTTPISIGVSANDLSSMASRIPIFC